MYIKHGRVPYLGTWGPILAHAKTLNYQAKLVSLFQTSKLVLGILTKLHVPS